MCKKIFTLNLFILTGLYSLQANAGFDPKYPAADFEPKIQFQSPEAQSSSSSSSSKSSSNSSTDAKYPAANFKPTIQFQDQDLIDKTSKKSEPAPKPVAVKKAAPAPKPAPVAKTIKPEPAPVKKVEKPEVIEPVVAADEVAEDSGGGLGNAFFVLLIFAVLLLAFKNKIIENATPHGLGHAPKPKAAASGPTGVEKYLAKNDKNGAAEEAAPDTAVAPASSDPFRARPTAG